ncbi:MAG TPA: MMPL family transporter [Chthoniobacterales bacterium]|nr:MMPL family transporter [Chthoniobacterales bacterium]
MAPDRSRLLGTLSQWAALLVCAALGLALYFFVDLTPEVEGDFFFSKNDPQARKSASIEKEFGAAPQIFVAVRSRELVSQTYLLRLRQLTNDLQDVKGVIDVRSVTQGPEDSEKTAERDPQEVFQKVAESPFWSRLLLAPDRSATFVVLQLSGKNYGATVSGIDRVLARRARAGFELGASGVPYVAEHIRRQLTSELQRFSIAAFAAFAILTTILFRSFAILLGTMVASFSAAFATFLGRSLIGMRTDILAPNLWTIAFVLTLSHVAYLAMQWRRKERTLGRERAIAESVRHVGPASIWSLIANLLGFTSLTFVQAKPLQQFGISGVIAAVMAIICAFTLFPPFLRAAKAGADRAGTLRQWLERFFTRRHGVVAACVILATAALAPFAFRVNTDPTLPSYFAAGERIRRGIEVIDRSGGSSPLDLVVADANGAPLDNDAAFRRLEALQQRLERHRDVGSALSISLLMAETKRPWYSFLFSWETRLEQLEKPEHGRIGRTFISEDRKRGRFFLRMKEMARSRPREVVVGEIERIVRGQGFRPVRVGGLYPLQGELSTLVEGSVIKGLSGLLAGFFLIVLIVSRSFLSAIAMTLCLAITPLSLFGLVGLFKMPLDIISAPAANVALPMGIDEMIHQGYTVRRARAKGEDIWTAWKQALAELWGPILASMLIVTAGFALFLLSSFPPTRRLGVLVCIGAIITDLVVLLVLPAIVISAHRFAEAVRRKFAGLRT